MIKNSTFWATKLLCMKHWGVWFHELQINISLLAQKHNFLQEKKKILEAQDENVRITRSFNFWASILLGKNEMVKEKGFFVIKKTQAHKRSWIWDWHLVF